MYDRTKEKKKKSNKQVIVNGKAWDKETLIDLLKRNDKAVERAILLIYSFQTEEEKYAEMTGIKNNKGFNMYDAEVMSSMAKQLQKGIHLTCKQMYVARPKIQKYTKQILNYMKEKENLKNNLETV